MAESSSSRRSGPTRLKSSTPSAVSDTDCELGELIAGTKAQLQELGLAVGLALPSEPGGPRQKLTCIDPRGFTSTISRRAGTDRGYNAHILFPHLPARPRSDRDCGSQNGVSKTEESNGDVIVGTADAIAAAGLVQLEQMPGQPGIRRTQVTILADGSVPVGPPTSNHPAAQLPGFRSVTRDSKTTFRVMVRLTKVERDRQSVAPADAVNAWASQVRAHLRPVKLKPMPAQWWSVMRAAANSAASDLRFQDALIRMITPATKALYRSAVDHADPRQQPVHSNTKSMRYRESIDGETRACAQSFQDLVRSIESDLPLVPGVDRGGCADPRDYRVLVRWLESQPLDEVSRPARSASSGRWRTPS